MNMVVNYRKYWKHLLFVGVCLLVFLAGFDSVFAYDLNNLKCPEKISGKEYAVFVITDDQAVTDWVQADPKSGVAKCALINKSQPVVSFEDLENSGAVNNNWAKADANEEILGCWATGITIDGPPILNLEWKETLPVDKDADEWSYSLMQYEGGGQESSCKGDSYKSRIRYRIETPGKDRYLYFMGFNPGSEPGEGEVQEVDSATCNKFIQSECGTTHKGCFWWQAENKCVSRTDTAICSKLPQNLCGPDNPNGSVKCIWNETQKKCSTPLEAGITKQYGVPEGYVGALPSCAFSGTCDDVNDLVQVIVNFGKGMFAIIGSFVFAFFVYGGLTIILSFGSAEKVKKGKDIMVAAVVGLAIVFLAYILINFMLDAIGVKETFKAVQ